MISALPPPAQKLRIVILGLSITSSWGNGHATTYRSLMRALARRGHDVLFLEREAPWYAAHRDVLDPPCGAVRLYGSLDELKERWRGALARADLVVVGSYVPEGIAVVELVRTWARGLLAFYDIDTPVTLAGLAAGNCPYLSADLVPVFDLYLSFTGGPVLRHLERHYGVQAARVLYCAVDPLCHRPEAAESLWDLGYLGTYSADRQPKVEALLSEPARRWPQGRFSLAGALYPPDVAWPANLERIEHIGPADHHWFYARQRFTLNLTRADMIRTGYSPSVRLFEAAACGVPIISDWWPGLDTILKPGSQILVARDAREVLSYLRDMAEEERQRIAARARAAVLARHTAAHRAQALETYVGERLAGTSGRRAAGAG
ncbi:MAG TPA: glycosyltransferase [Stellaceae bacterium]|nr:glycosyltransferase [Stellaceae bacterium]